MSYDLNKKELINLIKEFKKLTGEKSPGLCKISKGNVVKYMEENDVFEVLRKENESKKPEDLEEKVDISGSDSSDSDSSNSVEIEKIEEKKEINLDDEKEQIEKKREQIVQELEYSVSEMQLDIDYMISHEMSYREIEDLKEQKEQYLENISKLKDGILHPNEIILR